MKLFKTFALFALLFVVQTVFANVIPHKQMVVDRTTMLTSVNTTVSDFAFIGTNDFISFECQKIQTFSDVSSDKIIDILAAENNVKSTVIDHRIRQGNNKILYKESQKPDQKIDLNRRTSIDYPDSVPKLE